MIVVALERRQRGQDYGLQSEGTLTVIFQFFRGMFHLYILKLKINFKRKRLIAVRAGKYYT